MQNGAKLQPLEFKGSALSSPSSSVSSLCSSCRQIISDKSQKAAFRPERKQRGRRRPPQQRPNIEDLDSETAPRERLLLHKNVRFSSWRCMQVGMLDSTISSFETGCRCSSDKTGICYHSPHLQSGLCTAGWLQSSLCPDTLVGRSHQEQRSHILISGSFQSASFSSSSSFSSWLLQ